MSRGETLVDVVVVIECARCHHTRLQTFLVSTSKARRMLTHWYEPTCEFCRAQEREGEDG